MSILFKEDFYLILELVYQKLLVCKTLPNLSGSWCMMNVYRLDSICLRTVGVREELRC